MMTLKQKIFHIKTKERWFRMHNQLKLPVRTICQLEGIAPKTYYYWWKRYQRLGAGGLIPKPPGQKEGTGRILKEIGDRIERIRWGDDDNQYVFFGPRKIQEQLAKAGIMLSTHGIYNELKRRKLLGIPMPSVQKPTLYVKDTPGVHVQVDVKYTPRLYDHRRLYQFSAVDDCTRIAFTWLYTTKSEYSAVDFLTRSLYFFPFPLRIIQTDNGNEFRYTAPDQPAQEKHPFEKACCAFAITHIFTPFATPKRNGKVERFHGSVEREFYQGVCGNTPAERLLLLQKYTRWYNTKRPHLGLKMDGLTPWEKLQTFRQYQTVGYPIVL